MHRFMKKYLFPDGAQGEGTAAAGQEPQAQQTQAQGQPGQQATAIDYAKIQQMLEGTLAAKEETALKAYFKQQGLSQQEAEQAMATFKEQKARNQPDVAGMQTQLAQAQAAQQKAAIENKALMVAVELGIDVKSIPYVLKMADFSQVVGQDGMVNEDSLKAAVNKVLEDVPALKPQPGAATGFVQVGTAGHSTQSGQGAQTQSAPQAQVATKRWNRFN